MSDSSIFGLPDSIYVIISGLAITGIGLVMTMIPATPEIINIMTVHYKIIEGADEDLYGKMNDSISSIYTMAYNFGGMVCPMIGAALYD